MSSVKKVELIGRLGRDPEVRTFNDGSKVANLRVATSEKWTDSNTGERRERTEWHSVAIFGGLVKVVEQYARKGSQLYLEGRLETRKWQDQSGNDRYSTEVVLRPYKSNLVLLGSTGDRSYRGAGQGGDCGGSDQRSGPSGDIDDEIPF